MELRAACRHDARIRDLDHDASKARQGVGAAGEEPSEGRHLHIFLAKRSIGEKRNRGAFIHATSPRR
jgi:hypothetical protein